MLTADLVRARRREGRLELVPLGRAARLRALGLAEQVIAIARAQVGGSREELEAAWGAIDVGPSDRRLALGLRKLVLDRCRFESDDGAAAAELRSRVFSRAAEARRALDPAARFDRAAALAAAAAEEGIAADALERRLYADLRAAERLLDVEPIGAAALVEAHDLGQAQAVLLRAVRVVVEVSCRSPATYRRLFRKLKFLRLLHRIEALPDGYRIEIDGPYSLFSSVTKYGLALALLLPVVRECDRFSLVADVRWGRDRQPLELRLEGGSTSSEDATEPPLPDEARALCDRLNAKSRRLRAEPATVILSVPGLGECVPDLAIEDIESGRRVYLELLGYWSREAVFRRIELARAGLPVPMIFAVPARLRVSEEALEEDLPAALLVYRASLPVGPVEERVLTLLDQQVSGDHAACAAVSRRL